MIASIEGLDELRASLADAADQLADLSGPASQAGQAIAEYGEQNAPQLTGELAGSFGLALDPAGVTVTNSAGHALPVQFGTQFMDGQPFMPDDPAVIAAPIYAEYLDQVLSTIHGK